MNGPHDRRTGPPAFTLLEAVVSLAIVAVLLALAVPGYRHYQQRAERAEAVRELLAMAACQERLRADTGSFDTTRCRGAPAVNAYVFRIEPEGQTASLVYRVLAEPATDAQAGRCGTLSLDQAGVRGISGEGRLRDCWGGR